MTEYQQNSAPVTPRHVAIIMDGNNRWAQKRGVNSTAGHRAGVEVIRSLLNYSQERGVRTVTLFAFSSENWRRPTLEVKALMRLFSQYLDKETRRLSEDGVRLKFIGSRKQLSSALQRQMDYSEQATRANTKMQLVVAIDYGGQWDIVNAAKQVVEQVQSGSMQVDDLNEEVFARHLSLASLPDVDLCIRTGGDQRISNFLLWQLAYSELYFTECLWPDFDEEQMRLALDAYSQRERRFGGRNNNNSADVE